MKRRYRLLSILLCLCLVLAVFPTATTPKADASAGSVLKTGFGLLKFGLTTSLTISSLIAKNNGEPETAAMLSKWTFPGGTVLVPMLQELGKQMAKMHEEVMQELDFIENKLDKNISGIESALGSAATNDAYDNYVDAWTADVTVPMAANGYNQVVNAYKIYLEYAGSFMTGSTVTYGGQEIVATQAMVESCRDSFYTALKTMSGASYDANSGMTSAEYYDHILYETNTIDLKVQTTINNLLGRMLNATGAPVGGRYLDRAAQVAFAYFPFSEDQAAFVDAAMQKQAHEINMALLAYQEFIGLRLQYCDAKYTALEESGATEEELSALSAMIENYCAPNSSILELMYGGAACVYPGGVFGSMETWLSAPVYLSNADNSFLYLQDYLRATDTQKFTLTNTNFITRTDPDVLLAESEQKIISEIVTLDFSGPTFEDINKLTSTTDMTAEQMQFIRRGIVVPSENGRAVVKPIYMLVDETQDRSGMLVSGLTYAYRPLMYPVDVVVPNADFYNLRDGVYTDGHNTYTLTTGSRLQALTDNNVLSLGGGLLKNYFKSILGTYPDGREMYVLTGSTAAADDGSVGFAHSHSGVNMTATATFSEDAITYDKHASTSYMVVLDGSDSSYYQIAAIAPAGMTVSLAGSDYDASAGTAKAASKVTLTIAPGESELPVITAAYQEDALTPDKVTYTQVLADETITQELTANEDGTYSIDYYMPYANVTLVVGEVDETVCAHPADKLETFYSHATYGTHGIGVDCSACGKEVSYTTEDCYDLNSDSLCDVCGYALICPHAEEDRLVNITNYYGTHTIYEHCNGCSTDLRNVTEDCTDEDGDGICDVCNGDAECPHHSTWWQTEAVSNNDETHTIKRTCGTCGDVIEDGEVWPCNDGDEDGICDDCGYIFWCDHREDRLTVSMTVSFRSHTIHTSCSCGEYNTTVTEDCTDEDSDDYCDICGGYLVCTHDTAQPYINRNEDGTHTSGWSCGTCGESGSETENCYDEDSDEQCDLCGGAVEAGSAQLPIAGVNMTLGNELKLNFLIKTADIDTSKTYTAVLRRDGKDDRQAEFAYYNGTYYAVSYTVAAKEMADKIHIEVLDDTGAVISAPFSRSVQDYAMSLFGSELQDVLKSVVVDMLNYGTEAQKYFGYNEESYANCDITQAQQEEFATKEAACTNTLQGGKCYYGTNLSLESRILLNIFFSGITERNVEGMTATVEYTNYNGRAITAQAPISAYSHTICKVTVDEVVLADARCPVTIKVYKADGSLLGEAVESVESYIARSLGSETDAVSTAIMKFSDSARAYLGSK